jgi:hypothetical protein
MDSISSGKKLLHRDRATIIKKDNFLPELLGGKILPINRGHNNIDKILKLRYY